MKVAVINQPWNFCPPPEIGSIAIWTYQVVRRLNQRHEITVYARKGKQDKAIEALGGVNYRRFSIATDLRLIGLLERLGVKKILGVPLFASRIYYWLYALKVAWDIRKRGCEIIHVQNLSQFVSIIKALNPAVKIVLHMHCEWLTQLDNSLVRQRLAKVEAVLGCSEYISQLIRDAYPEYAQRTFTVYNGVDASPLLGELAMTDRRAKSQGRTILFVGRITPEKGLHVLLEAFKQVLQALPGTCLKIIGPEAITPKQFIVDVSVSVDLGHLEQYYERSYLAILKDMLTPDMQKQVEFVGKVAHGSLSVYYANADLLVNPSFSESFGMTLIEAMTFGLPVVATRVGGMTEIVEHGQTGFLVAPGEIDTLAEAMLQLLTDENKAQAFGAAGRNRASANFSWEAIADSVDGVYSRLGHGDSGLDQQLSER